jgi:putative endonuclease
VPATIAAICNRSVIASRRRSNPVFGSSALLLEKAKAHGMKQRSVYIMTNKRNGTLYTGVTSNLMQRVYQHREAVLPGFTARYACKRLVWYECHEEMVGAIAREKQIKAGSRKKKLALIEAFNPHWRDLYDDLM